MTPSQRTLAQFQEELNHLPQDSDVRFVSLDSAGAMLAETQPGYHLTELRAQAVRSVDCAGRLSNWTEAQLQVLDGSGEGALLTVAKVHEILSRAAQALSLSPDTPLSVEHTAGSEAVVMHEVAGFQTQGSSVRIALVQRGAECRPAAEVEAGAMVWSETEAASTARPDALADAMTGLAKSISRCCKGC